MELSTHWPPCWIKIYTGLRLNRCTVMSASTPMVCTFEFDGEIIYWSICRWLISCMSSRLRLAIPCYAWLASSVVTSCWPHPWSYIIPRPFMVTIWDTELIDFSSRVRSRWKLLERPYMDADELHGSEFVVQGKYALQCNTQRIFLY